MCLEGINTLHLGRGRCFPVAENKVLLAGNAQRATAPTIPAPTASIPTDPAPEPASEPNPVPQLSAAAPSASLHQTPAPAVPVAPSAPSPSGNPTPSHARTRDEHLSNAATVEEDVLVGGSNEGGQAETRESTEVLQGAARPRTSRRRVVLSFRVFVYSFI